jgi:glycosyltransferase involved in cell wall biosynthesis
MRIVCCNKYFFVNGGTEQYLFRLLEHLPRRGCQAVPFSVAYAGSRPSPYAGYFLPPPGEPGQTHYASLSRGLGAVLRLPRLVGRAVWSFEAGRALARLLDDLGEVDAGYVLNIYNYMSPSVIDVFAKRGIPVVMRLGDYHPVCLSYHLSYENRPCERCLRGAFWNGMVRRCVKGSLAASLVRGAAMYVHRLAGVYDRVDAFVTPCRFMREKLIAGGFPAGKIHVLPQGVETDIPAPDGEKGNYILAFGRLSPEKGLDTLLEAYQDLAPDVDLVLAGRGVGGYEAFLKGLVRPGFEGRIRFPGFVQGPELSELVSRALCSVTPSRVYDNAPLSVLESAVRGTPSLGADIGGIPELIEDGVTGALFTPGDAADLADRLGRLLADRPGLAAMGRAAREKALRSGSLDDHLTRLLALFRSLPPR